MTTDRITRMSLTVIMAGFVFMAGKITGIKQGQELNVEPEELQGKRFAICLLSPTIEEIFPRACIEALRKGPPEDRRDTLPNRKPQPPGQNI